MATATNTGRSGASSSVASPADVLAAGGRGTNEPSEIGGHVSSGCIRMRDMDAIDLYNRVHIGTPVVVIG
jgi:hypothetical protein